MAREGADEEERDEGEASDGRLSAVDRLAEALRWKEEQLDPTCDPANWPSWRDISEHEREFYRCCIEHLIRDREMLLAALP